jgi:hypothetical protein
MIYFAQADISGQIKIGYHGGTDANDRLRELQTGCPTKLFLLGTLPGGPETEADLHKRFAFAHVHGEWFNPVPELLAYIGQQSSGLNLNGTAVESRFVQIKILTVGGKRFSQALLFQLPDIGIIDWSGCESGLPLREKGQPWGWIRMPSKHPTNAHYEDHWLIWQWDNTLLRCIIPDYFPSLSHLRFLENIPRERAAELSAQYRHQWEELRHRWYSLDQLFIGV